MREMSKLILGAVAFAAFWLIAAAALPADVTGARGAAVEIEGYGPAVLNGTLPVPQHKLVDIHIRLEGDVLNTVSHLPSQGLGMASWLTGGRTDGVDPPGFLRPLRARVMLVGPDLEGGVLEVTPSLFASTTAQWNRITGGTTVQFDGVVSEPEWVIEDVPAWRTPLGVKVDLEMARTNYSANGTYETDFDLLQRVVIAVTEATP